MRIALTRDISPAIDRCELTHVDRHPIDLERARAQHARYEDCLRDAGCVVTRLSAGPDMPDSVFIEDIAVVFPEIAVITRPGAGSRRVELPAVVDALHVYRPLRWIEPPAMLDGGDVLVVGKRVFIGVSQRTNTAAVSVMEEILDRFGYGVCPVSVDGCLHLKSAVTALSDSQVLINRQWVSPDPFKSFDLVDVDRAEPSGANALRLSDRVLFPSAYPRTRRRIERVGLHVTGIDADELAKAEGGVTCCSLIFDH